MGMKASWALRLVGAAALLAVGAGTASAQVNAFGAIHAWNNLCLLPTTGGTITTECNTALNNVYYMGDGTIRTGYDLCLQGSRNREGRVWLARCANIPEQRWWMYRDHLQVQNQATGLCLDVHRERRGTGAPVVVYDCYGGRSRPAHQKFVIKPVPEPERVCWSGPARVRCPGPIRIN